MVTKLIRLSGLIWLLLLVACSGTAETTTDNIDETAATTPPTETPMPAPTEELVPADTPAPDPTAEPTAVAETGPEPESETEAGEPEEASSGVETAAEPVISEPFTEEITVMASDGLVIQGTFTSPGGEAPFPGVILLHMLGSNREVWVQNGFADRLGQHGYATLAVDMRGHGATGGAQDWLLAAGDMVQVWTYFSQRVEVNEEKTAVVGASIGSNLSLITGVNIPAIDTVVLLSPGLDYLGVTTDDQIEPYGERPILIVASEEDGYAAESSRTLHELAPGEAHLEMYNGAGHGTLMFDREPGLSDLIIDWLDQHVSE